MTNQTNLQLREPTEIAAAIPYLLGFHPDHSLVCLWMRRRTLQVTQRADLPGARDDYDAYVRSFVGSATFVPKESVVAVCFSSADRVALKVLDRLRHHLDVPCEAALVVDGARVRDVSGHPDGDWIWIDTTSRERVARIFDRGNDCSPVSSRDRISAETIAVESVCDALGPMRVPDDAAVQAFQAGLENVGATKTRVEPLVALADRDLRDIAGSIAGRDAVIELAASVEPAQRTALLARMLGVLRGCPGQGSSFERTAAANVAVAACAVAWLAGDGVRANAALDRALGEVPDHRLGGMLASALAVGLPPGDFAQMVHQ